MSRPAAFVLIFALIPFAVALPACKRKLPKVQFDESKRAQYFNVDYQMKQLDSKTPGERVNAMFWLERCDKNEAQKAIPKLQEIASKDKNEGVRKIAQETIKKLQGG